jgi:hypothetical protein
MSTLMPSRRLFAAPTPVRVALLAIAAAVVGIVCGRLALSRYGKAMVEALVVAPILIVAWSRPLMSVLLLLALPSVSSYGAIPRVNVPGHPPLNLADVLLAVTVGGTLWRRPWTTWPLPARRFATALALLLVVAAFPTIRLAIQGHAGFREALLGYKNLLYMSVALTVALELSKGLWRPLLNAATVLAAVIALLSILAAASSAVAHVVNALDASSVTTASTGGVSRIRLPGLFFAYAMVLPTFGQVLLERERRWLRIAALALMAQCSGRRHQGQGSVV